MKKIKKTIIIITVLIIIILIGLVLLRDKNSKVFTDEEIKEIETGNQEPINDVNSEELKNATMFYTVENCVQTYVTLYSLDINNENPFITEYGQQINSSYTYALSKGITTNEQKNEIIYNMLDTNYINQNDITVQNINDKIGSTNIPLIFSATKIRVMVGKTVSAYSVVGRIKRFGANEYLGEVAYKVTLDELNMTFTIEPLEDLNIDNLDITIEEEKSIENHEYNVFQYSRVDELTVLQNYVSLYKNNAVNNPEIAYEYIDSQYKNARFGNIDKFKEYVDYNMERIQRISVSKYSKEQKDGYTQYVCIDTDGNYYIIKETATMQFGLILDTYTLDLPEFTEKYENADDMTKVGMNIEKIKEALNSGDYEYVYNKFTDGFKNNYFKTVDDFKNYVQQNWYKTIKITYNSVSTEGSAHVFEVYLSDGTGENSNVITKNFNVRLQEGTDFIFSFNV